MSKKKLFSLFFLIMSLSTLLFKDNLSEETTPLDQKQLKHRLEELNRAWEEGSIDKFLKEKGILKKNLINLYESKNTQATIKKDILNILTYMFPEDVPDKIFINSIPAKRMREIEKAPKHYRSKLLYKALERETVLSLNGASNQTLPETYQIILGIYKGIAGFKKPEQIKKPEDQTIKQGHNPILDDKVDS